MSPWMTEGQVAVRPPLGKILGGYRDANLVCVSFCALVLRTVGVGTGFLAVHFPAQVPVYGYRLRWPARSQVALAI